MTASDPSHDEGLPRPDARASPSATGPPSAEFLQVLAAQPQVLADLVRTLTRPVRDEPELLDLLARAAAWVRRVLPDVHAVSITTVATGAPATVASAGAVAGELDGLQYALDDGPCLRALRTGRRVSLDVAEVTRFFPDLGEASRAADVRWWAALPLGSVGDEAPEDPFAPVTTRGVVNLYAAGGAPVQERWSAVLDVVTELVDSALVQHAAVDGALREAEQLREAMRSRAVIEQAKGVLMARHRVDPETAFDLLRSMSRNGNVKLRDLASRLVRSPAVDLSRPTSSGTGPAGDLDAHGVFQHLPLPAAVVGPSARVVVANRALSDLLGTARTARGRSLLAAVHPTDLATAGSVLVRPATGSATAVDVRVHGRDGDARDPYLPARLYTAPLPLAGRTPRLVVHVLPRPEAPPR